jgi:hypothetical protein
VLLQGQLQQLAAHANLLHCLADKMVKLLAKFGPAALKDDSAKAPGPGTQQQLQEAAQALGPLLLLQQQQQGRQQMPGAAAAVGLNTAPTTAAAAGGVTGGSGSFSQLPLVGSQVPPGGGSLFMSQALDTAPGNCSQQQQQQQPSRALLAHSSMLLRSGAPGSGGGAAGGDAGSGGCGRGSPEAASRLAGTSGGGHTARVRQAQDDRAARQVVMEHQALVRQWQQLATQLGTQLVPVQLQLVALQWQPPGQQQQVPQQQGGAASFERKPSAAAGLGPAALFGSQLGASAAATHSASVGGASVAAAAPGAVDASGGGGGAAAAAAAAAGGGGHDAGPAAQLMAPARTKQVKKRAALQAGATGSKRPALLGRGR